ncbi:MAG: hypothetical protein LBM96_02620 [Methanobrevibacter sp.]|jgi:hypothetical protein|nr:hypothetical protein [Candidatus Methanoflexus mossambicus]
MTKKTQYKLIIPIILISVIFVSGCINFSLLNINNILPELSNNIVEGDKLFNDGVILSNSKNYDAAEEKIGNSLSYFINAKNNIEELEKDLKNNNDTILNSYIFLLKQEVSYKENATDNLQTAIRFFLANDTSNGNKYVNNANKNMNNAIDIQKERNQIVIDNPEKFK